MTRVRFLKDYENHVKDEVYDVGRAHHVDTLIRQGIAVYEPSASREDIFAVGQDGVVNGPTQSDVDNNFILQADNDWVDPSTIGGHTGTTGSIFFADAGGAGSSPTENNAQLFIDNTDTAEVEVGIGLNTPSATLHLKRTIAAEADHVLRVERNGSTEAALIFYVGAGAASGDLVMRGDGHAIFGGDQAVASAQLNVKTSDSIAFRVDQDGVGSSQAVIVDSAGVTGDVIDVTADSLTTATMLNLSSGSLTSGSLIQAFSASTSTTARDLVDIRQTHASGTNSTPLRVQTSVASGLLAAFRDVGSNVIFQWLADGVWKWLPIADGSETDVAPSDDHTLKKLSLQKLAAPPSSAAYLAFTMNGAGEVFYLVLEEG